MDYVENWREAVRVAVEAVRDFNDGYIQGDVGMVISAIDAATPYLEAAALQKAADMLSGRVEGLAVALLRERADLTKRGLL